jgi:putative copper resistance protein D
MDGGAVVAVRGLLYALVLVSFGLAAFGLYSPAGRLSRSSGWIPYRRLLATSTLISIAAAVLGLLVLIASMAGTTLAGIDSDTAWFVVAETPAGLAGLVRIAALGIAFAAAMFAPRTGALALVVAASGVAAATLAWNGHGAMTEGALRWLHLGADMAHLLTAGLWLGALAGLVTLVCRGPHTAGRIETTQRALEQFAGIGTAIVVVLAATGVASTLMIIGADHLIKSLSGAYARLLVVKLLVFGAMLALAALNRFRLTPRLGSDGLTALRASLIAETASLLLILAIVAKLGTMAP